jgi:hypothetical protein
MLASSADVQRDDDKILTCCDKLHRLQMTDAIGVDRHLRSQVETRSVEQDLVLRREQLRMSV